jgi:hypothetical protein
MLDECFAFLLTRLLALLPIWNSESQNPIEGDELRVSDGNVCALSAPA